MVDRKQSKVNIGPNQVRYVVRVTWDPGPEEGQIARMMKHAFMTALADQEWLTNCGPVPFQTLFVKHNGEAWEAVAEAEVEESTGG